MARLLPREQLKSKLIFPAPLESLILLRRFFLTGPVFLLILFTATLAFCETSIKAELDKSTVTTDDNITYELTIVSSDKNIPAPRRPKFEGFNIVSRAQSSSISLAGGQLKSVIVYAYVLRPNTTGKIRIEPAKIKFNDEILSTSAFNIEINPGRKPVGLPQQNQPESQEGLPESKGPQITL